MFCKQCGKEIDNDANFCVNCGAKVMDIDSQSSNIKEEKEIYANLASKCNKPKKKPFYRRWWFIVIMFVLVVNAFIQGTNSTSSKKENTGQVQPAVINSSDTVVTDKGKNIDVNKEEKKQKLDKEAPEKKILEGAVSKLTKKGRPKTYAKWGDKWIKRINDNLPLVALKVAEREVCDKVTNVDISDSRSTPKKEAIYYADCANGQRFYLSEKDLQDFVEVMSVSEKTTKHDDYAYISTCKNAIKGRLTHPSTFDDSWINTSVHRADIGNVSVRIPFEAKNSFNLLLEMEGICYFDDRGLTSVDIREK